MSYRTILRSPWFDQVCLYLYAVASMLNVASFFIKDFDLDKGIIGLLFFSLALRQWNDMERRALKARLA